MAENIVFPKVILKKKQVQTLIDFCLDEAIEFGVKQQVFPAADYEVELKIKDMKLAVLLGMFLRENKLEMDGIDSQRYKKTTATAAPTTRKSEDKAEKEPKADKQEEKQDNTGENAELSLM